MTKERPILFSAPMVRAILDGSKTQTRRVAKEFSGRSELDAILKRFPNQNGCPYGKPGDRLWVRETFALDDNGHNEWPVFRADGAALPVLPSTRKPARWVPSIHMPRWASRILLEIVSVRVERLRDISEEDARAEGTPGGHGAIPGYCYNATAAEHYFWLWDQINGAGAAEANPWVWVVEFKRVAP